MAKVRADLALDTDSGVKVEPPYSGDTTAADFENFDFAYDGTDPDDSAKKNYNPDQPRDSHGRFGSGGSSDESDSGTVISHNLKLVAQGVVLTAAAALAVALAPEAGAVALAATAVSAIADKMFVEAGVSAAKHVLKDLGVPGDAAEHALSSVAELLKSTDPQSGKIKAALRTQLGAVADEARDLLVEKLEAEHPDAKRLDEVTAAVAASCDSYKAALADLA